MNRILTLASLTAALAFAACDGPRENAGEEADAAANLVDSEDTLRSGPNEEMGARQDAAAEAAADSKEAQADALEAQAAESSAAARQRAATLRNEADTVRKAEPAPPPPAEVNGM